MNITKKLLVLPVNFNSTFEGPVFYPDKGCTLSDIDNRWI